MKKLWSLLFLCCFLTTSVFAGTKADSWPEKPITIVVPWAVGGLADQTNRAMAQFGEKYFQQPVLPTNKLGAGGIVALTEYKLRERGNTHKLIYASEGNFGIAPLYNEIPFKIEDFKPVINVYTSTFVLVAGKDTGIKSIEDLKEYAKSNPVNFAVNGLNGSEYLLTAALLMELGIDAEPVSYEGANQAMNATVAGDTTLATTHFSLAKEFVKSGQLLPVVAFSDKPIKDEVYDLKPVTDYGYDIFFTNKCMMFTSAKTDDAVVKKIYTQMKKLLADPEFMAIADKLQLVVDPIGPDEMRAHINNTTVKAAKYHKMIQANKK